MYIWRNRPKLFLKRCDTIDTTKTHQLPLQLPHSASPRLTCRVCYTLTKFFAISFSFGSRLGIHMWIYMHVRHVLLSYMNEYMILHHFRVAMHVLRTEYLCLYEFYILHV